MKELILAPVFFIGLLLVGLALVNLYYPDSDSENSHPTSFKKYFFPAFLLKLIGSLAYCLIYQFYYKGGDTIGYYKQGTLIWEQFYQNPSKAWALLRTPAGVFDMATMDITQQIGFFYSESTMTVVRLASVLGLFTFNSFFASSFVFAALSFSGLWALYRVLLYYYPRLEWQMAVAVFLVPSVVFWDSGIMKDTVMIGALGWLIYAFYYIVIRKERLISSTLLFLIAAYLIWQIKFYILVGLLPMFFVWGLGHHWQLWKDWRLRAFLTLCSLVFLAISWRFFGGLLLNKTGSISQILIGKVIGMQTWHGMLGVQQGGSYYSLGEIDFTLWGIIRKVPASINVTFFRPYLFEVQNPVMLIAAFESTLFLLATVFVVLRVGFLQIIRIIFSRPFLLGMLLFILLFGFMVGFTSYNFGALVRYKTPCLPLFVALFFILLEEGKQMRSIST